MGTNCVLVLEGFELDRLMMTILKEIDQGKRLFKTEIYFQILHLVPRSEMKSLTFPRF